MESDVQWMRRRVISWGRKNRRDFPWRTVTDPFRVLVAEILLQRTRAETVVPVYRALFARWRGARELAAARTTSIVAVIRPLGLVHRAARLRALASAIRDIGGVPRDFATLRTLPGVGRYVANATAEVAFGTRAPTVDGVSARVYRRFFGLPEGLSAVTDGALWALVEEVTPRISHREWNWAVLDLAAAVCTPTNPDCGGCPLRARCRWPMSRR